MKFENVHRLTNCCLCLFFDPIEVIIQAFAIVLLCSCIAALYVIIFPADGFPASHLLLIIPPVSFILLVVAVFVFSLCVAASAGLVQDYKAHEKKAPKPLYVIDPKNFDGTILTSLEDGKHSQYHNGQTLKQIHKAECNKHLRAVSSPKYHLLLDRYYKSLCKPFAEISEHQYNHYLNCLPPKRWHNSRFFVGECYAGTLHQFSFRLNGKYYSALRSITLTDEELARQIFHFSVALH